MLQLSQGDRTRVVAAHNHYRSLVASGRETRGQGNETQPKATNMNKLVWDDELAEMAQR